MIFVSGLVCFLLVLTAEARVGNSSELSFCTETPECLLFDLICKTKDYEVRHYDSVKWVSTNEKSFFMEMAMPVAFNRLFKYISGENQMGKKIQMTTPVVVKIPDKRFWQMGTYTMSFLLPTEHQENPPKPTNSDVYITDTPDMKVYAYSYGGWMTTFSDSSNANDLSKTLDSVKAKYKKGSHCAVGYNSPMRMFNRHNEVWFVAEDEPVCEEKSSEETD
ncbi:heme-binding protein 2 [Maylandia zebra]|uniref:Heme-binding protein 1 n=1 Tax=Maylandia zebra TaxID=106582 RepID=A0A3P9CSF2_9CICH|nr:heme-binding protein 2 [Maylandia zebra]